MPTHHVTPPLRHTSSDNSQESCQEPFCIEKGFGQLFLTDEISDSSYPDYLGSTSLQRYHRDLLRRAMQEGGFAVYDAEWWHFDYRDWQKYPILNKTFEQLSTERR